MLFQGYKHEAVVIKLVADSFNIEPHCYVVGDVGFR